MRYLRLLFIFMKYNFKTEVTYRTSYFINRIAQACAYGTAFVLMWIMVGKFDTINGWNKYEVMMLYATSLLSYSVAGCFVIGLYNRIQDDVRDGTFDDVLIKPVSILPFFMVSRFSWAYTSHIFLSVSVLAYSFRQLHIEVGPVMLMRLCGQIIAGAVIYFSLLLMIRTPVFFVVKFEHVSDFFFFFREMSYYPVSIYPKFIQGILIFVLPYAFINYIPLKFLLGKADGLNPAWLFSVPLVAVTLLTIAVSFFYFGVDHYKSTGS